MKKVTYKNLSELETLPAPTGDGFEPEFGYNSDGELVEVGKINTVELIQSHAEECSIDSIIARCLGGDESALSQRAGQYIDTVGLPSDLLELQQMKNASDELIDSLSEEDRKAFFDDPEKFFDSKTVVKTDEQKKAELLEALKNLTGKEVIINE